MNQKGSLLTILLLVMLAVPACAGRNGTGSLPTEPDPQTLTVLAAASLTEVFTEMGAAFEAQHPGVEVEFSFAGSQQLVQQMVQGAPADVFASASQKHMDDAVRSGRVAQGIAQIFARNRLVIIFPKDNPARVSELKDLARPGIKLVLAIMEVPVGQYSLEFLEKARADPGLGASFEEDVLKNVVSYEENVKAVLAKVALNEADAGIVYLSDISAGAADQVGKLEIPEALNVSADYPVAMISDSQNPALAQAFVDFVLSPEGQALIERYSFMLPR